MLDKPQIARLNIESDAVPKIDKKNEPVERASAHAITKAKELLDSFSSSESPTPYLGILKLVGDSGDTFTLEIDPSNPAAEQFLTFNRPFGESGNLRLGASLDLKTNPIPTAYELAIRGELPVLGGEAGLTISAAPPTQEESAYFETLATYIRRF